MHCATPSTSDRKAGDMSDLTPAQQAEQLIKWMQNDEMDKVDHALANNKIDLNVQDSSGEWPIMVAASSGYEETCLQMIEHGAKVDVRAAHEMSLLHWAIENNMPKLFDKLISMNVIDIDAMTTEGVTPLHHALFSSNIHYYETLLEQGADPNLPTKDDESPLTLAAHLKNPALCQLLIDNHAHVKPGGTNAPFCTAIDNHDFATAELFLRHGADWPDVSEWKYERLRKNMLASVYTTFEPSEFPEPEKYFTGNKPSEAVLNACALGQFEQVTAPLMLIDKKRFGQLIDALPKCWNRLFKGLKVTAAKGEEMERKNTENIYFPDVNDVIR